jgi:DNA-binding GntR family transcriptional regulator
MNQADGDSPILRKANAQKNGKSLTEYARCEIERMILSGEIAAGERLHEQTLAAQLGTSRGPVREAIRALESDRLLSGSANQGAFVRHVTAEEAAEIYDVRSVLFGLACYRLAGRLEADQVSGLEALVRDMAEAAETGDAAHYYELNLAFHDDILRFCGHRRTQQIYRSLLKELHLLRRCALMSSAPMRQSNEEHAGIVSALVAGDAERARRLAEDHAQGGKRRWLESLG